MYFRTNHELLFTVFYTDIESTFTIPSEVDFTFIGQRSETQFWINHWFLSNCQAVHAATKPASKASSQRRLEFARQYHNWMPTEWRKIAFYDKLPFFPHWTKESWRIRRETSQNKNFATIIGMV
ncbi:hypothetical protein TNCV_4154351 [Trichonephila clavipes]|nr:hypothetical protein TNCV_4154351 [Trichonephila clavipes]